MKYFSVTSRITIWRYKNVIRFTNWPLFTNLLFPTNDIEEYSLCHRFEKFFFLRQRSPKFIPFLLYFFSPSWTCWSLWYRVSGNRLPVICNSEIKLVTFKFAWTLIKVNYSTKGAAHKTEGVNLSAALHLIVVCFILYVSTLHFRFLTEVFY